MSKFPNNNTYQLNRDRSFTRQTIDIGMVEHNRFLISKFCHIFRGFRKGARKKLYC